MMSCVCQGDYRSFMCPDFETTGLSGQTDRVAETGAVKVLDGQVVHWVLFAYFSGSSPSMAVFSFSSARFSMRET